jgi:hypothetical protein
MHNTLVGQVIYWIRIDRHIVYMIERSKSRSCIHNDHTIKITISSVTPYLLTSMATIYSISTTIIVVKSEDLEIFSVERQLISYQ